MDSLPVLQVFTSQ